MHFELADAQKALTEHVDTGPDDSRRASAAGY
jgi:hypothetical protein